MMDYEATKAKKCSKCKEVKSLEAFHKTKRTKSGVRSYCNQCSTIYNKSRVFEVCVEEKKCSKCKEVKSLEAFHKNKRHTSGISCWCKQCTKTRRETTIFEDCVENKKCTKCKKVKTSDCFGRDKHLVSGLKSWCLQCLRKHDASSSICKLGLITPKDAFYIRENAKTCAICENEMKTKCIDHCHKTNKIRGVLCSNCNCFIGLAKDDPSILRKGINYLKKHSTQEEPEPKRAHQLSLF